MLGASGIGGETKRKITDATANGDASRPNGAPRWLPGWGPRAVGVQDSSAARACSLVRFSHEQGCASQHRRSLASEIRPICSFLQSLAEGALNIVRALFPASVQATKHQRCTHRAWLTATKQQEAASADACTRKSR